MTYAGIDYGTSRVAIVLPELGIFDDVVLRPGDNLGALDVIAETCWNTLTRGHATVVAIEAPIVGMSRNLRVGVSLGMVAGALCITARQAGATVLLAPPATWKKAVTGRGNANKDEVADWLGVHHPDWHARCHTQDTVDACCLALYAKGVVD